MVPPGIKIPAAPWGATGVSDVNGFRDRSAEKAVQRQRIVIAIGGGGAAENADDQLPAIDGKRGHQAAAGFSWSCVCPPQCVMP